MAQINFEDVFNTLKQGIVGLAQTTVQGYVSQAQSDGQAFLDQLKDDLETWTQKLAEGQLTQTDFTDLVEGQKDLLELAALKQAGLAEIALDNFKSGVFSLIEKTVFSFL